MLLGVARSGYYAWQRRAQKPSKRTQENARLLVELQARQFGVSAPNPVWVADITYVATDEGWVYVALVMDLFLRKLVGWALEAFVDGRIPWAALRMALGQRHPNATLVHHSDRGVQ